MPTILVLVHKGNTYFYTENLVSLRTVIRLEIIPIDAIARLIKI